jgi:hypothetical protein
VLSNPGCDEKDLESAVEDSGTSSTESPDLGAAHKKLEEDKKKAAGSSAKTQTAPKVRYFHKKKLKKRKAETEEESEDPGEPGDGRAEERITRAVKKFASGSSEAGKTGKGTTTSASGARANTGPDRFKKPYIWKR